MTNIPAHTMSSFLTLTIFAHSLCKCVCACHLLTLILYFSYKFLLLSFQFTTSIKSITIHINWRKPNVKFIILPKSNFLKCFHRFIKPLGSLSVFLRSLFWIAQLILITKEHPPVFWLHSQWGEHLFF